MRKKRVLFLCTGNSARSQMAEALLRHLAGEAVESASAGITPKGLHPLAVTAMADMGVDISHQKSKGLDAVLDESWDFVITVCDNASESCPVFPGDTQRVHWSFEDPAAARGSDEYRLEVFRRGSWKSIPDQYVRELCTLRAARWNSVDSESPGGFEKPLLKVRAPDGRGFTIGERRGDGRLARVDGRAGVLEIPARAIEETAADLIGSKP